MNLVLGVTYTCNSSVTSRKCRLCSTIGKAVFLLTSYGPYLGSAGEAFATITKSHYQLFLHLLIFRHQLQLITSLCYNSSQVKVTSLRDSSIIIILLYSYLQYYLIIFNNLLLAEAEVTLRLTVGQSVRLR
jgi:hypothetical protein